MTLLVRQIAEDMGISNADQIARTNEMAILTKKNPVPTNRYVSLEKDGYGIKLWAEDSEYRPIADDVILVEKNEVQAAIDAIANDAAIYSAPSNGVLPYFTTIFNKDPIKQILRTTPLSEMTEDWQQGEFGTTDVKMPTVSYLGNSEIYSDTAGTGQSSVNYNWVPRQAITLERTLAYGDMTQAQFAMAKINYVGDLRTGLTSLTALEINDIGFNGFAGYNIFGLLNDPSLNPTVVFPVSVANPLSSLWIYKTFDEIVRDIRSLWNDIIARAGGNVNYTDSSVLGLPPSAYTALTTQNALSSVTVFDYCKLNFPGMKIIQVPNYQGTGTPPGSVTSSKCQLILDRVNGQRVAYNIFSSLYNSHGMVRMLSSFQEKISYTISGGFLALALGVSTGSGC